MAAYLYRCERCGPWEVQRPIGTAQSTDLCPACGAQGRRVYTPPLLSRTPAAVTAVRQREEASRDAPQVTGSVPGRSARRGPRDPRWNRLPRP